MPPDPLQKLAALLDSLTAGQLSTAFALIASKIDSLP